MFFGDKTDYYSLKIATFVPEIIHEQPHLLMGEVGWGFSEIENEDICRDQALVSGTVAGFPHMATEAS